MAIDLSSLRNFLKSSINYFSKFLKSDVQENNANFVRRTSSQPTENQKGVDHPLDTLKPGAATLGFSQFKNEEKRTAIYFYEDRIDRSSPAAELIEVRTGVTVVNGVPLMPIMVSFPNMGADYLYECWLDPIIHREHLIDLQNQEILPVICYDKYKKYISYEVRNVLPQIIASKNDEYTSSNPEWSKREFQSARNIIYDRFPTPQDLFPRLHNSANSDRWSF